MSKSTVGTRKSEGIKDTDPKPELTTAGRKIYVILDENEILRLFLFYRELLEENSREEKPRVDAELWRDALRKLRPFGPWPSQASFGNYKKRYAKYLEEGKLNVEPAPHDHRPLSERGFVKRAEAPPPAPEEPSTPPPPPSPATAPVQAPSIAPAQDPVQMIATGLAMLVQRSTTEAVVPLFRDLVKALDRKLDDQYLRLLEYWDPEAAKQAREGAVQLPKLEISLPDLTPNVVAITPPAPVATPAPTPAPKKHKVLIVGGKEDGFWSYLQDVMPECVIKFADGHKPKSIPTGTQFDYVLVHWMTSHPARAVIKNYYPDHDFMSKGGQSTVVDMICSKLGIDRRTVRERRAA